MRLLALVPKPEGLSPGQRFRFEQWAPLLAKDHGISVDFVPFESPRLTELLYRPGHVGGKAFWISWDFFRRARAVLAARKYDGVVVYREASLIGPAFYERILSWLGVPIFYDFDDSIWLGDYDLKTVNGLFARLHFSGKTAKICALSSAVIVGNEYLAAYARRMNENVCVVPTTIDLGDYPVQPEPGSDDPIVICWTGSTPTLVNFELARPALEDFAASRKIHVKVICNRPPAKPIAGAENSFIPWTVEGEAEAIGSCHIGIMPLPDDIYHKGKCALKALQYMATGRPVVASPVGVNEDIVDSSRNGFLASTKDEWIAALGTLAGSASLRREMGIAARRTVEEGYSAEVGAAKVAQCIRVALDKARTEKGPDVHD